MVKAVDTKLKHEIFDVQSRNSFYSFSPKIFLEYEQTIITKVTGQLHFLSRLKIFL